MRITLFSDLEARIEAAVLQAIQQAILETKIAAAVQQTLCDLNFQSAFRLFILKSAAESIYKSVFKSVFESALKSAAESICESVYEHVFEPVFEPAVKSVKQKKQLQLLTSKQSFSIAAEFIIFIQSCFSYHASYDHKSFYLQSLNQHLHHSNQY